MIWTTSFVPHSIDLCTIKCMVGTASSFLNRPSSSSCLCFLLFLPGIEQEEDSAFNTKTKKRLGLTGEIARNLSKRGRGCKEKVVKTSITHHGWLELLHFLQPLQLQLKLLLLFAPVLDILFLSSQHLISLLQELFSLLFLKLHLLKLSLQFLQLLCESLLGIIAFGRRKKQGKPTTVLLSGICNRGRGQDVGLISWWVFGFQWLPVPSSLLVKDLCHCGGGFRFRRKTKKIEIGKRRER